LGLGPFQHRAKRSKSFFGSFFSKKELLSFCLIKFVDAGLRRHDVLGGRSLDPKAQIRHRTRPSLRGFLDYAR
jgi:hypothetical protein